ncbi:MAG TPA: L-fucose/L-arabinose isomerase family protein [Verrucomicrobiae bacterium]|nr:L-fucose/L-arabinose isomerase family protein [Verrucomicrobiae bacterium]
MKRVRLGVIIGNRGFFPGELCVKGRERVLRALQDEGIDSVLVPMDATRHGAIESLAEAQTCAALFKQHREEIDGILVTLPNFGDERAVANTIRFAGLDVPVLVHAFSDDPNNMAMGARRDSFCGKMSACNNLRQYNIKYSLTGLHTVDPENASFHADLRKFAAVCRIVKALRGARLGAIGARPTAFNTVRYSEKLLEQSGISVETLDLSELLGWVNKMNDTDAPVKTKLDAIRGYTQTAGIPEKSLFKMAKMGAAIDKWMTDNQLVATAIQCWTALEEFYGIVPCTLMSMMSNKLMPSACETDVAGLLGMYILDAAAGKPAALLDWNNNYGTDPNKGVVFHCSNLPKDVFSSQKMDFQEIIAGTVGKDNTYGTIVGRIKPGPFTYCRVSTDDLRGRVAAYCGEGRFTDDKLNTFGGFGVIEVPAFQQLLAYICENGFEHHVAANLSETAEPIAEALSKYMGWDVYHHRGSGGRTE